MALCECFDKILSGKPVSQDPSPYIVRWLLLEPQVNLLGHDCPPSCGVVARVSAQSGLETWVGWPPARSQVGRGVSDLKYGMK